MYRIDIATAADATEISELRKIAFSTSREFSFYDIAQAAWDEIDESSVVLAARENGAIISSLRAIKFADTSAAERFVSHDLARHDIRGSVLVMSRVVTDPDHFKRGLMGAIRFAYVTGLLRTAIENVVGVVYEGGPRISSLRRAGFELFESDWQSDSEVEITARPLISVLRRQNFEKALAQTQAEFAEVIEACAFDWDAIHARFAQVPRYST